MSIKSTTRCKGLSIHFFDGVELHSTCPFCKSTYRTLNVNGICNSCKNDKTIVVLPKEMMDEYKLSSQHILFYFAMFVFKYFSAKYEKNGAIVWFIPCALMKKFKELMFDTTECTITCGTMEGIDQRGKFISFNQLADDKKTVVRTCKFYDNGTQAIVDCAQNNRTKIITSSGHTYEEREELVESITINIRKNLILNISN